MASPVQRFVRHEWVLFKAVVAALPPGVRRPNFGDGGIAAITFAEGDMRFMRGSPNVRYTIDDAWIIARAKGGPRGSNQAYPALCGLVTNSGAYLGSHFSASSALTRPDMRRSIAPAIALRQMLWCAGAGQTAPGDANAMSAFRSELSGRERPIMGAKQSSSCRS